MYNKIIIFQITLSHLAVSESHPEANYVCLKSWAHSRDWGPNSRSSIRPLATQSILKKYFDENIKTCSWQNSLKILSDWRHIQNDWRWRMKPPVSKQKQSVQGRLALLGAKFQWKLCQHACFCCWSLSTLSKGTWHVKMMEITQTHPITNKWGQSTAWE